LKKIMKKIFFNNTGLTCNFAEALSLLQKAGFYHQHPPQSTPKIANLLRQAYAFPFNSESAVYCGISTRIAGRHRQKTIYLTRSNVIINTQTPDFGNQIPGPINGRLSQIRTCTMPEKQEHSSMEKSNLVVGLSTIGALVTGIAGLAIALVSFCTSNRLEAAACLGASALAFGLLANAVFRK